MAAEKEEKGGAQWKGDARIKSWGEPKEKLLEDSRGGRKGKTISP